MVYNLLVVHLYTIKLSNFADFDFWEANFNLPLILSIITTYDAVMLTLCMFF